MCGRSTLEMAQELSVVELGEVVGRGKGQKLANPFYKDFKTFGKGKTYFITHEDWLGKYAFRSVNNGPRTFLRNIVDLEKDVEVTAVVFREEKGWTIKRT